MKSTTELRSKQKMVVYEDGMNADHVLVHLDARRPGVVVPKQLTENYSLTLKLSYHFQGQIKHDDELISAFLKFGNQYFECLIPWKSIWGISPSEGQNRIWPEDLPKELILEFTKAKFKELAGKPHTGEDQVAADKDESSETAPSPEERRKQLKLVK